MSLWIPLSLLGAYLLGSAPFGYLAGILHGVDPRKAGSGNIGATNVLRVLGKGWGAAVFVLDVGKGALGVLLGRLAGGGQEWVELAAALLVILGHNYPVWLGFRGGKGIATSAGVFAVLFPWWVAASAFAAWLILFFATRIVSIASIGAILAIMAIPLLLALTGNASWGMAGFTAGMGVLALARHRSNIGRLLAGTEPAFGMSREAAPAGGEEEGHEG